ncbi:MAG: D-tagatose-bisphosphate aldolase, class II, non-catalytic subunit [Anaerolineales bacterium]|nr:D-tagatose-bisphosphate aldolase, class II, non-catalytic subunit [Anaerolineales bacterium]
MTYLDEIVRSQKQGLRRAIVSVCSAHPWVLRAAMLQATASAAPLLVEATCNQVNQFGGYTGMTPVDFVRYVGALADESAFSTTQLLLGGDHLGPFPWQAEPAAAALAKAAEMVGQFVQAGFTKIHLDASMRLGDDPPGPLAPQVCAQRTAELAGISEAALPDPALAPRYVIGTEVPVPGGATEHEAGIAVTPITRLRQTIDLTQRAFAAAGLESAWERVIAIVVQPGVEFGDDFVLRFDPAAAGELTAFLRTEPHLVYEAHSTDYQTPDALRALVEGGFAILKVGPALTFAFREAVFGLAKMENELIPPGQRSCLVEVLEEVMLQRPAHWDKYYHGDEHDRRLKRKFSLSDRARYYWPDPQVQAAFERLLDNLGGKPLPQALVSQYAPIQYERVRRGEIQPTPEAILLDRIRDVLRDYQAACAE